MKQFRESPMMKRFLIAYVIGSLLTTSLLLAQEDVLRPRRIEPIRPKALGPKISLGVEGGLNVNFFSQNLDWIYANDPQYDNFPNNPFYRVYEKGIGFTPFLNIIADLSFSPYFGIQFKTGYEMKNYSNTAKGGAPCVIYDEFSNTFYLTETTVESKVSAKLSYWNFTITPRYSPTPDVSITFGPTLHLLLGSPTIEQQDTIIEDDDCYFTDDPTDPFAPKAKSRTLRDTVKIGISPRWGIEFGIGYKIPLSEKVWLSPFFQFQYFLSHVTDEESYAIVDSFGNVVDVVQSDFRNKLHSLRVGLLLLFDL